MITKERVAIDLNRLGGAERGELAEKLSAALLAAGFAQVVISDSAA